MGQLLFFKKLQHVGLITLENPAKKNAISPKLIGELREALNDIETDNSIRVTIITSSSSAFCAGYDISELGSLKNGDEFYPMLRDLHELFLQMEDKKKPIIAAINGIAMGGGFEMSMACDIRIAAESAVFALPEINMGLLPAAGGMTRLPRLVGAGIAKELIFTGRRISAEEALRIGLVNKVVSDEQLLDEAMQMANLIASKPPISIAAGKNIINQNLETDLHSATINESRGFVRLFDTEDAQEGIKAFLEKRTPNFKG